MRSWSYFDKAYTDWNDAGRPGKEPTQKDYIRESELIKQNALKLYETAGYRARGRVFVEAGIEHIAMEKTVG